MPVFGVSVVVIADTRVLLQLREDLAMWNLPGGLVESGESLAEAAIREVREETGLAVRLTQLVGVYSRPQWRAGGNHQVLFVAEPVGGDLGQFDTAETREARFFDPAALPDQRVWWNRRMIADALDGVGGGVARSLDIVWTEGAELREVIDRARRDPAFAERLLALFCAPPAGASERLDVGAP